MGNKFFKIFSKKTISSILIFSMIFGLFVPFLLFPKPAKAVPVEIVFETPNVLIARKTTTIVGRITVANIIKNVLAVIWETIRLRMLNYLTNVIVLWIEYGPEGSSQYVKNYGNFIGRTIGDSVGRFIYDSEYRFICEPWRFQIRNSLVYLGRLDSVACRLDLFVRNIEDYWGDFRQGGLMAMGVSIHNNYFSDYINMQTDLFMEAMRSAYLRERDISPGGFVNVKRCVKEIVDPFSAKPICLEWEIVTPGRAIGDMLSEAIFTKDIKYVINAEEVSAFAAAIINAGINRLIREGVGGIAGLAEKIGRDSEIPLPDTDAKTHFICDKTTKTCSVFFSIPKSDYYSTIEECIESCMEDEEETSTFNDNPLACGGNVFVRARPPASCIDGVCPRCTGIGGTWASDCCFVFCKHTKDVEWKSNTEGKQFTSSEVDQVCNFFGLSSPSDGCLCKTRINEFPFYDNDYVGKFRNNCFECSEETFFGANLCKKTTWCEGGTEPTPPPPPESFVDIKDRTGDDGPIRVEKGSSITIEWTSKNVIECTASGSWAGYREPSGSESFDNITTSKIFILTCKDSIGEEVSDTFRVVISI